jgi:hypothetical protein
MSILCYGSVIVVRKEPRYFLFLGNIYDTECVSCCISSLSNAFKAHNSGVGMSVEMINTPIVARWI